MPYKDPEKARERQRRRREERAKLDDAHNQALFLLYDAMNTGEMFLYADEFVPNDKKPLISLSMRKLIKRVDKDLWRITLAGLLHVRQTHNLT